MEEILPHAESALTWMSEFGDADGDGFLGAGALRRRRRNGWVSAPSGLRIRG
ncbi:hypothetical protein ACFPK5_05260 [Streptomyces beijiangensis]|uniref:hypothetical protein n=1 Tax=Streptomyces beijiangensis TaxID=163361 RepID=UPI00361BFE39